MLLQKPLNFISWRFNNKKLSSNNWQLWEHLHLVLSAHLAKTFSTWSGDAWLVLKCRNRPCRPYRLCAGRYWMWLKVIVFLSVIKFLPCCGRRKITALLSYIRIQNSKEDERKMLMNYLQSQFSGLNSNSELHGLINEFKTDSSSLLLHNACPFS